MEDFTEGDVTGGFMPCADLFQAPFLASVIGCDIYLHTEHTHCATRCTLYQVNQGRVNYLQPSRQLQFLLVLALTCFASLEVVACRKDLIASSIFDFTYAVLNVHRKTQSLRCLHPSTPL